jgi:hypothetical protein
VEASSKDYGLSTDWDSWLEDVTNYVPDENDSLKILEAGRLFVKPLQQRRQEVKYRENGGENRVSLEGERVPYDLYRKVIRTLFKWEGFSGSPPFPLKVYSFLSGEYLKADVLMTRWLYHWSKAEPGGSTSYTFPEYEQYLK